MHVDWSILLGIKTKSVISTQPAPFEFRAQKINDTKDPNRSNPIKRVKISIFSVLRKYSVILKSVPPSRILIHQRCAQTINFLKFVKRISHVIIIWP